MFTKVVILKETGSSSTGRTLKRQPATVAGWLQFWGGNASVHSWGSCEGWGLSISLRLQGI